MKYACLVYVDASLMEGLSEKDSRELTDDSVDFDWKVRNSGRLILAQPLQPPETAVTIRLRNGRMSSTDGPFAETKEHLGGFFLIEARDLNEAMGLAMESPMAAMGSIEVRPFLEQTHSVTGKQPPKLQE
ncbi:YciI family protein [Mesorhizobium sp. BAC0120]|uniref:YciI family protein n=1 Tax=Mesorhizobium sp. BAC0120 TaxID=3090670 RepID=UPI00298C0643|nr:YciI family protein [Mesorhizobium sp. BAC0120]MDW6025271.1 YciI family protein [Mesorhizobium sp. BAC0120]